jgi:hypothetical protein
MITKARCTTTSAPATTSATASASSTSAWRYFVLRSPASAGSKGLRAMASMRPTSRRRSSARSNDRPMSPVGPVTATVSLGVAARAGLALRAGRAAGFRAAERVVLSFELERGAGTARVYAPMCAGCKARP